MNRQSGFLFTMQFYDTCRIPDETKNILGPKINPPNFQALISPSPEIFPCRFYMIWYAKKWKVNVCGWFIHGTICWILLFIIWQSELCGQHCTRAVLPQSDCFEYPLKLVPKMSIDIYIFQSFLSVKKSRDEKLKRNPFIISVPL